jgi:hypothetical protein
MIKNKTELQIKIFKAIQGEKIAEVIHAFEVIKIDLFLNKDLTYKATADNSDFKTASPKLKHS